MAYSGSSSDVRAGMSRTSRAWGRREGRVLEAEGTVRAKAGREKQEVPRARWAEPYTLKGPPSQQPPLAHSSHAETVAE